MRVRTFMALPLDEAMKDRLASAQADLAAAGAKVRWVAREALHLTVKFLGSVEDRALGDVCAAAADAAAQVEPFRIGLTGLTPVPAAGALRMIWAAVDEPTGRLERLNALLEAACEALGFKAEKRAYRPHLTLGRVKGGRNLAELRAAAAAYADVDFGDCAADELIAFASELGPQGPTHTALSHARLGGP